MVTILSALITSALAFNGILAGASLDQSIKQLPARHKIGVVAYSAYSQASDLGNGIRWYAILGIGAAVLTVAAAFVTWLGEHTLSSAYPIYLAAVLSILHSLTTTQAASTLFSQRRQQQDETALMAILDRFERWQTLRAALQVLSFGALLWTTLG